MSDMINRQDAIDAIEKMQMLIMRSMLVEDQFVFKGMSEVLDAIKQLPTVNQWIPCSRELPKKNGTYIVKCERSGEQYYDMLDFDATMIAMKWNTTAKVLKWCEIPKEVDNEQN